MPDWTLMSDHKPPKGEPLIVTIQCRWKNWREVVAPVYYLYDMRLSAWVFYDGIGNNIIGPDDVKIVAWMPWPKPCEADVRWDIKDAAL